MRIRHVLSLLGIGAVLVATGCGGAKVADVAALPASASLAPADAMAFVTLNTDEGSTQWQKAESILELFPDAQTAVTDAVSDALSDEGLTWSTDIAPALGPEVVVVVTAAQKPVVLTQPDDTAKLDALLAKGDERLVRGEVDGWTALAETQGDIDALAAANDRGTLDSVDSFAQGMGALPDEALARGWVDVTSLTKNLADVVQENGGDALLEQLGTDGTLDLGVESLAAALSTEDDGVFLSVGVNTPKGTGGTHYEAKLFEQVPADAVAALSFGGSQATFDKLRGGANLDGISKQLESVTGVSLERLFDAFSGEGLVYVRPGEGLPQVTVVLSPGDAADALETVDGLMRTIAGRLNTQITTGTEDGVEVSRLTVQGATVSYGLLDDDTVIVAIGDGAITAFQSSDAKLVDSDGFTKAAERVSLDNLTTGFVFVDLDGLIPLIEGLAGPDSVPPEARNALQSLDSFILSGSSDGDLTQVSGFVRVNR